MARRCAPLTAPAGWGPAPPRGARCPRCVTAIGRRGYDLILWGPDRMPLTATLCEPCWRMLADELDLQRVAQADELRRGELGGAGARDLAGSVAAEGPIDREGP